MRAIGSGEFLNQRQWPTINTKFVCFAISQSRPASSVAGKLFQTASINEKTEQLSGVKVRQLLQGSCVSLRLLRLDLISITAGQLQIPYPVFLERSSTRGFDFSYHLD